MPAKSNTLDFIAKSKAKYGENAFDYSNCTYKSSRSRVTLFCNKHNISFTAEPNSHLTRQNGCPECGKEATHAKRALGLEGFITRSKEKFGDTFDYSDVKYKSLKDKVRLYCKKHNGYILISPSTHLSSETGCQICTRRQLREKQRISKEVFIQRAKQKYGEIFDYSNLDYTDYLTETLFNCNKHGVFRISPWYHLLYNNGGCPGCVHYARQKSNNNMSTAEFVDKLKVIFGDKYDYTLTDYFSYKKKVNVKCHKHNYVFQRLPQTLLNGVGCPICEQEDIESYQKRKKDALERRRKFWERVKDKREKGKIIRSKQKAGIPYGKDKFLEFAKEIHGDDFSYDKVEFVNMMTPVTIHCNYHNYDFYQTPQKHLMGQGCPKCIGRNRTNEDFIREARDVHGDRFDYSRVQYKDCTHKVEILCKKHNKIFRVLPIAHLEGDGCPECCKSALELRLIAYLTEHTDYTLLTQHLFPWLKTSRSMPLDIYIPELKIAIECQGLQHFFPRPTFGGIEGLEHQKKKDKLKYALCEEHGIKLIYFVDKGCPTDIKYYGKIFRKMNDIVKYLFTIESNTLK